MNSGVTAKCLHTHIPATCLFEMSGFFLPRCHQHMGLVIFAHLPATPKEYAAGVQLLSDHTGLIITFLCNEKVDIDILNFYESKFNIEIDELESAFVLRSFSLGRFSFLKKQTPPAGFEPARAPAHRVSNPACRPFHHGGVT